MPGEKTEERKEDHVEIVTDRDTQYKKTTGFDQVDFVHNSLPELDVPDVDLSTKFVGKKVDWPILITGMTGGYDKAKKINRELAKTAEEYGLAFGLGSQRAMIEKPELKETYDVRDFAPSIPLLANIGGYQLKEYSLSQIRSLITQIDADALAIHLNPLQEVIQEEGDTDFNNVLEAIEKTSQEIDYPIIAKETGGGISRQVASKLKEAGVDYVGTSGAGGTSWSKVEYFRSGSVPGFENWGNPTVECIIECQGILPIIGSGGIRTGIQAAKALGLGSSMAGAAYPFIKSLQEDRLDDFVQTFLDQLRTSAYLTGSKTLKDLQKTEIRFL